MIVKCFHALCERWAVVPIVVAVGAPLDRTALKVLAGTVSPIELPELKEVLAVAVHFEGSWPRESLELHEVDPRTLGMVLFDYERAKQVTVKRFFRIVRIGLIRWAKGGRRVAFQDCWACRLREVRQRFDGTGKVRLEFSACQNPRDSLREFFLIPNSWVARRCARPYL